MSNTKIKAVRKKIIMPKVKSSSPALGIAMLDVKGSLMSIPPIGYENESF